MWNKLKGGQDPASIEAVLGQLEPNGVLKVLGAFLVSMQSADDCLERFK
jgi:hypothetical protein